MRISHHKQPSTNPLAPSHMAPGRTETQRSRETVGLVPPSVSVVGNLPAVPKNASHTQHPAFINTHTETKAHAQSSNAHVLTITPSLWRPHLPPSRAILFHQKHFLCICCPLSDDFQTSPVIWWRTDGSWNRNCLEKPQFALNKVAVAGSMDVCKMRLSHYAKSDYYLLLGEVILA